MIMVNTMNERIRVRAYYLYLADWKLYKGHSAEEYWLAAEKHEHKLRRRRLNAAEDRVLAKRRAEALARAPETVDYPKAVEAKRQQTIEIRSNASRASRDRLARVRNRAAKLP